MTVCLFLTGLLSSEEVIVQFKRPHCVKVICISQSYCATSTFINQETFLFNLSKIFWTAYCIN